MVTAGLGESQRAVGFTGVGGEGIGSLLGKRDPERNMRKGTSVMLLQSIHFLHSWLPEKEEMSKGAVLGLCRLAGNLTDSEPCGTLFLVSWYQEQPRCSRSTDLELCSPRKTLLTPEVSSCCGQGLLNPQFWLCL